MCDAAEVVCLDSAHGVLSTAVRDRFLVTSGCWHVPNSELEVHVYQLDAIHGWRLRFRKG